MIEYRTEDYDLPEWNTKLKNLLGNKLVGLSIRGESGVIEIRTTGDLTSAEKKDVQALLKKRIAKPTEPIDKWKVELHWAKIKSFNPSATKPLTVERVYDNKTYTIDCYVTTQIKDEYQAGTLNIGDFVLISFIDGDPDKACAILKAYKSW